MLRAPLACGASALVLRNGLFTMTAAAKAMLRIGTAASPLNASQEPRVETMAARSAACDYEIITTREGFNALESEWNALFNRAGSGQHMFQTFNWLWHWSNHFLPEAGDSGPRLSIVTARQAGRLVLVWPLVKTATGAVQELRWMGEPVSQYGDVLIGHDCDSSAVLHGAWLHLKFHAGASVLQLNKVRTDSNSAQLLTDLGAQKSNETVAPYLDLSSAENYQSYEQRYSSGTRRNRNRQRRRLGDRGTVRLEWHKSGAETEPLVTRAFELKQTWLKHRGIISPALADQRTKHFFVDVARANTRPAGCHVAALLCGETPVAMEIGLQCHGRTAIHIIAYDLDFEKTAAGALLMEDSIRHAYEEGCTAYDLLAPGDSYKMKWADDTVSVADWSVPLTSLGWLYANTYSGLLRPIAKRAVNALPAQARRTITSALFSRRD